MGPTKPKFHSVVDLGLRDVGVENQPRRLTARLGLGFVALFLLVVVSTLALCVLFVRAGVGTWIIAPFFLVWLAVGGYLTYRALKRSSPVVVRVNAEGTNHATWLLLAHALLLGASAVAVGGTFLIPLLVFAAFWAVIALRGRKLLPETLRELRTRLAGDERVLGDGLGLARGERTARAAFRVVVATDRRLLVAESSRAAGPSVQVDAPYRDVTRFGIEWRQWGRIGVLSVTVLSQDGPEETHEIGSIAPLNLLSIAQALESNGVHADDPEAVPAAERAWEEAQREAPRRRLLDRAAMRTRDFDRGLWLLLALSGATFWVSPFAYGPGVLVIVAAVCVVSGYLSATRSSLAYTIPLNLLVTPAFFFTAGEDVLILMFAMTAVAAVTLWAGTALRGGAAGDGAEPRRGGLRRAVGALTLIRLSAALLALMLVGVTAAAAAGFDLHTLRLEATAKQLSVDGRSNLTGGAASLEYTPRPGLREFVTDEDWGAGPNDGARWELRSSFTDGYNVVSLSHYIFEPRLGDAASVAGFVADKDAEHSEIAGHDVTHSERMVDGRRGYVWRHIGSRGYRHFVAWFPHPVHTIRVECVAGEQVRRFRRLCSEAMRSLEFH